MDWINIKKFVCIVEDEMPFRTIYPPLRTPPPPPTNPTPEQWKKWDELDQCAASAGDLWMKAVEEQMSLMKNNASSFDIAIAGEAVVKTNAACNHAHQKQVEWSQKFGFQNFKQLLSKREATNN